MNPAKSIRTLVLLILIVGLPVAAAAQGAPPPAPTSSPSTAPPPPPLYRWFAGGAFGMSFSNVSDYVELSPLIGYKVTPKFQIGSSITFRYRNDKRYEPDLARTDFGVSLVGRYFFFGPVFAQAEVERIEWEYLTALDENTVTTVESTYTGLYGGVGFVQGAGRGAMFMSFLWDFNYRDDEPNPSNNAFQIRIGYGMRF